MGTYLYLEAQYVGLGCKSCYKMCYNDKRMSASGS